MIVMFDFTTPLDMFWSMHDPQVQNEDATGLLALRVVLAEGSMIARDVRRLECSRCGGAQQGSAAKERSREIGLSLVKYSRRTQPGRIDAGQMNGCLPE